MNSKVLWLVTHLNHSSKIHLQGFYMNKTVVCYTYWTQMKSEIHWTPESGLHTNDKDSSVLGKNYSKIVYVGVNTENKRQTCKTFKSLINERFFSSFKFVLLVNVQILSPFQRSQSLGNAAIQFWKNPKKTILLPNFCFDKRCVAVTVLKGKNIMKKQSVIGGWGDIYFYMTIIWGLNIP